jgi:hypothetical protein
MQQLNTWKSFQQENRERLPHDAAFSVQCFLMGACFGLGIALLILETWITK